MIFVHVENGTIGANYLVVVQTNDVEGLEVFFAGLRFEGGEDLDEV